MRGVEPATALPLPAPPRAAGATERAKVERFRALVDAHYEFVWRSLRRLGIFEANVDDATQQVFLILSRKLVDLVVGCERAFLFRTAMGVAANERRAQRLRRREASDSPAIDGSAGPAASPEELLRWKRARLALDEALDAMAPEQRSVFVLAELEGFTAPEIADAVGAPLGTVASRLRRAREEFHEAVARLRALQDFRGAP